MLIKKFLGKTEEAAMEAARKELGSGVVLLNAKAVKKKGLAGIFGAKQVEVTVAREEEDESLKAVKREAARKPQDSAPAAAAAEPEREAKEPRPVLGVVSESSQSIEKKLDSLQTLLVNQIQQSEAIRQSSEEEKEKPAEKNEVKKTPTEQERFLRLLYNTMLENEVDEKYANWIMEDVAKSEKPDLPIDYILANVYQKMILKLGKADGITPAEKGPKIVVFMGPTGVGKTTTIAKIASNCSMVEQKKVALFTADTYRIAAAEQLRTYASILEVPFHIIYTEEELKKALESFKDFDYIFVDSSGHSYQNEELLKKMQNLLKVVSEAGEYQAFLVLSAGTKYNDLQAIASSYSRITDYQFIFTKLDETLALGNLFNLRMYVDKPIAFVTNGQNVPDDIEQFNPQKAVKCMLSTRSEK